MLLKDPTASQGPKAVLGPGTGLGEAQLFWDEIQGGYKVWPSEGSHSGFAPRGWKQRALQASSHCRHTYRAVNDRLFHDTLDSNSTLQAGCDGLSVKSCVLAASPSTSGCLIAVISINIHTCADVCGKGTGQLRGRACSLRERSGAHLQILAI